MSGCSTNTKQVKNDVIHGKVQLFLQQRKTHNFTFCKLKVTVVNDNIKITINRENDKYKERQKEREEDGIRKEGRRTGRQF